MEKRFYFCHSEVETVDYILFHCMKMWVLLTYSFLSLRGFGFSTTRLRKLFLDGIGPWWVKSVISNVFKGESISS